MEFELDINARHLVEWLKADMRAAGEDRFEVSATRSFEEEPGASGDDVSPEDATAAMTAIGILELRPKLDSAGRWLVRIRVEDVIGPHLPEEGSVPDEPEELSLEGFETDFLLPDRGTAFATLEVESETDREQFVRFVNQLQTDRHAT